MARLSSLDGGAAGVTGKDEHGPHAGSGGSLGPLSTMPSANRASPPAAQPLMGRTAPRLTAAVYTDEQLLPLAATLQDVPAIPADWRNSSSRAAQTDLRSLVAELSPVEPKALLRLLSRSQAG